VSLVSNTEGQSINSHKPVVKEQTLAADPVVSNKASISAPEFVLMARLHVMLVSHSCSLCFSPRVYVGRSVCLLSGMDVSPIDLINIERFSTRVVSLADYRRGLQVYLRSRMSQVAPNLSALIGEVVSLSLCSIHACSQRMGLMMFYQSVNPLSNCADHKLGAEGPLLQQAKLCLM